MLIQIETGASLLIGKLMVKLSANKKQYFPISINQLYFDLLQPCNKTRKTRFITFMLIISFIYNLHERISPVFRENKCLLLLLSDNI